MLFDKLQFINNCIIKLSKIKSIDILSRFTAVKSKSHKNII